MPASFLESYRNNRLSQVSKILSQRLSSCDICPRRCKVNRLKQEKGFCKTGSLARVCSFMPHHGEEPPISGTRGSGTIFFSYCNMRCLYCQNYEFSQLGQGKEVEAKELAGFMLKLEGMGCHNINLVTPTHNLAQILEALCLAVAQGLKIPLVYNTSGYELAETIRLLDGIVDVYLADARYADNAASLEYSLAPNYVEHNQDSLKEMHRQAGIAKIDNQGIIKRGLIIRHLVMPQGTLATDEIMRFIAAELSTDTYISLMSQYFPCYKAPGIPEISRRITYREYAAARKAMRKHGLYNGWTQSAGGLERFAGTNIKSMFKNTEESKGR
jgi:putative pyruvate formate lyase activating enzyme